MKGVAINLDDHLLMLEPEIGEEHAPVDPQPLIRPPPVDSILVQERMKLPFSYRPGSIEELPQNLFGGFR